jgi:hypothetical protein
MSWTVAKIKINSVRVAGMINGEKVTVACPKGFDGVSEIVINGKKHDVVSCRLDSRDGVLHLIVAKATTKKEKSDGESVEGSDIS